MTRGTLTAAGRSWPAMKTTLNLDQVADRIAHRRDDPGASRENMTRRNTRATLPKTLDKAKRQVQWVLTTEDPALVYDWSTGRVVLEVLLMSGVEFDDQTPLLRDHNQFLVTAILGSVTECKTQGDELVGLCTFGEGLDDVCEGIWRRVEQGHLRRGSIGYDYSRNDYVTINAGQTATIDGRSFTAPKDRDLRVVTRWNLREFSMVVIPADARAQAREQAGDAATRGTADATGRDSSPSPSAAQHNGSRSHEEAMKKFLSFLHKNGLAATITNETEALTWARSGNLPAPLIAELAELCKADGVDFDPASATPKREQQTPPITPPTPPTGSGSAETPEAIASRAIAAERERIAAIRTLAREHSIDPTVVDRAENEGFTLDQTRDLFLQSIRNRQPGAAPAQINRGSFDIRTLQAAFMQRCGITPDSPVLNADCTRNIASRSDFNIGWACGVGQRGERYDQVCVAFDAASRSGLMDASLLRLSQELYEFEHHCRAPYNNDELFERVFSSSNFTAVFGAVVHLSLFNGYMSTPKVWADFVDIMDVADFRDQKDALGGEVSRLKKQAKHTPGEATTLNMTDPVLASLAAERFAGKIEFTDQSFISDNLGILGQTPEKVGLMSDGLIADIVFSELLSTANLADSRARFNTTDGNKIASGGALTPAGLGAAEALMRNKKVGDRRISLGRTRLIVGTTFAPTGRTLQTTGQLVNADNPFAGTFDLSADSAIDIGVSDPRTDPETAIAGRPGSYFLTAAGAGCIKVVFRTGTNRGPISRPYVLDKGKWGRGWDVYVDVGAAFLRRLGIVEVVVS